MRRFSAVMLGWIVLISLTSCSRRPDDDLKAASESLDQARSAEAHLYASDAYQEAVDALETAKTEIQAQDEKFALSRSYGEARNLLTTATAKADQAVQEAQAGREQARQEAETAIQQARTALDAAQASIQDAPRGKGSQADVAAMNAELDALRTTLQEAESALQAGDFLNARTKAETVLSDASSIQENVQKARNKKAT